MTTATLVPLDEYLHTSYHPDCDWVDGELKERNMGDGPHSTIQSFFIGYFAAHALELQIRPRPELRVQVSQSNYRVPDVLLVQRSAPLQRIVTLPPLLCIEVLSPEDRMTDMEEKIADYLSMGVPTVWVVDPRRRTALQIDARGRRHVEALTAEGLDFNLPVVDVFAELVEMEALDRDRD